jgi:hypothetical protein
MFGLNLIGEVAQQRLIRDIARVHSINVDPYLSWIPGSWQINHHDPITPPDEVLNAGRADAASAPCHHT